MLTRHVARFASLLCTRTSVYQPRVTVTSTALGQRLLSASNRSVFTNDPNAKVPDLTKSTSYKVRRHPWFYGSMAAAVCLLTGGYLYCREETPFTERKRLILVPREMEQKLGDLVFQQLVNSSQQAILAREHKYTRASLEVCSRIINQSGMDDLQKLDWQLVVIDAAEPNAMALPGGKVVIFSGLFQIVRTENELAVILGHEIAHVAARHNSEGMTRRGLMFVVGLILQMATGIDWLGVGINMATVLPHSRSMETEADYIGLILSSRACYDPRAAVRVWERMEEFAASGADAYFSTHPSGPERLENVKQFLQAPLIVEQMQKCAEYRKPGWWG